MRSTPLIQTAALIVGWALCLPTPALAKQTSVIVGFHQKPGPSEQALIHGAKGVVKRTFRLISAIAADVPEGEIDNIKTSGKVKYVEEDGVLSAVEPVPADEYLNSWGVYHILADVAHASGNTGAGINVAILDTGMDYTHPDLQGSYQGGYDFVSNDDDPFEALNSHGTHVAGIIAAAHNGVGVVGVAPEAQVYSVRVLDSAGFGSLSWILAGIEWAVLNGMDVINLSFEGMAFQSLEDTCIGAYNSGLVLVAAGGNTNGGEVRFPAAYDSVVAVTATVPSNDPAWFSPAGPELDLAAPGLSILSTVAGGGYDLMSGTSQAAPHVAGTAALLFASVGDINADGTVDNKDVIQALRTHAMDLGPAGRDDAFGFGLVSAAAASFLPADLSFTVTRAQGASTNSALTHHLAGLLYEVSIANNGLNKLNVDVYEGDVLRRDLSSSYRFGDKRPQEVTFPLDATGKRYRVTFTPVGKAGASAEIIITAS